MRTPQSASLEERESAMLKMESDFFDIAIDYFH